MSSQKRATNTTQDKDMSAEDMEEMALNHAPPEARERILKARRAQDAERKEAARVAAQVQANVDLMKVNARFRRAEREADPERAGALRAEAEEALRELGSIPAATWRYPWHALANRIRECALWIPRRGPPLMVGDHVAWKGGLYEVGPLTVGEKDVPGCWLRDHGSLIMTFLSATDAYDDDTLQITEEWPAENGELLQRRAVESYGAPYILHYWSHQGWAKLAPEWQERFWPAVGAAMEGRRLFHLDASSGYWGPYDAGRVRIPIVVGGRLRLLSKDGKHLGALPSGAFVVPPTATGWARLLALAAALPEGEADITWTDLDLAARFWWGGLTRFPKGILSSKESA